MGDMGGFFYVQHSMYNLYVDTSSYIRNPVTQYNILNIMLTCHPFMRYIRFTRRALSKHVLKINQSKTICNDVNNKNYPQNINY